MASEWVHHGVMDISKQVARVRDGLDGALSLADEATREVASRVVSASEPTLRLALIDAVTEAVDEINQELPAAEVTVALSDGNPHFVVRERSFVASGEAFESDDDQHAGDDDEIELEGNEEDADETLVRFSLRLPRWAKDKVDDRAERRGMSTNAYLTELIIAEIAGGGWGQRGGRDRFGSGPGFGPGKGWNPGSFLDPQTAGHIANVLSEVFGTDPRRGGGPGRGRPGGPHRGGPHDRGPRGRGPRDGGPGRGRRDDGPSDHRLHDQRPNDQRPHGPGADGRRGHPDRDDTE